MEIIYTIFWILKLLLLFILLFIVYQAYYFVYVPWRIRQKYKKYPNVAMMKEFAPVLGNIKLSQQYEKENKYTLQHFIDIPIENPDVDFYIAQLGSFTLYEITSTKSQTEFEKLVPDKIDRHDCKGLSLGNMINGAFVLIESNKDWNERRPTIMKIIGINHASKFIPMMIEAVDEWFTKVKKNEAINLSIEMKRITFRVISKILFGKDIYKMDKTTYVDPYSEEISLLN